MNYCNGWLKSWYPKLTSKRYIARRNREIKVAQELARERAAAERKVAIERAKKELELLTAE